MEPVEAVDYVLWKECGSEEIILPVLYPWWRLSFSLSHSFYSVCVYHVLGRMSHPPGCTSQSL